MTEKIRDFKGKWSNSQVFREEALAFKRNGYYCSAPIGTNEWKKYWDEQLSRCMYGYEVAGERITGQHYFYLNFCNINRINVDENDKVTSTVKEPDFPDFWDWDYEYYWWKEIARNGVLNKNSQAYNMLTDYEKSRLDGNEVRGYTQAEQLKLKETILYKRLKLKLTAHTDCLDGGKNMIVAKARRKGFSYKMVSDCLNNYSFFIRSQSIVSVSDSTFGNEPELFITNHLAFVDENTAFGKTRDYKDKSDHKRASFQETINGRKLEKGYMSELYVSSFKDKVDKARGKSPKEQYYEEAGTWVNLIASFKASQPGTTDGKYRTGMHIVFGTGGKVAEDNGQFSEMFYNPFAYDMMAFKNIWDENAGDNYCGFFFSALYNLVGFYDKQGNTEYDKAWEFEKERRTKLLSRTTSASGYHQHVTEFPIMPAESFGNAESTYFPVAELTNQYNKVIGENLHNKIGTPCNLLMEGSTVIVKPILRDARPIHDFPLKDEKQLEGCVVIYEAPVISEYYVEVPVSFGQKEKKLMSGVPYGLYKIGYDPYRQDQSEGPSLGAIYVYKGVCAGEKTKSLIVAEYVGRPYSADVVSGIALKLAILYNTEVMYENEVTHVKTYFQNKGKLDRLAAQPDTVISKNIQNSKVARVYGCHMNEKMKDAGEKYIRDWLLEVNNYDENDEPIYVYQSIYSPSLLQEMIKYNRKKNFDRVMALMQVMIQVQADIDKVYSKEQKTNRRLEEFKNLYKKK
jgi:hypothetical protein